MQLSTSLAAIREQDPCPRGWKTLLNGLGRPAYAEGDADVPVTYATILRINGLEDAAWACCVTEQYSAQWRRVALLWLQRLLEHVPKLHNIENEGVRLLKECVEAGAAYTPELHTWWSHYRAPDDSHVYDVLEYATSPRVHLNMLQALDSASMFYTREVGVDSHAAMGRLAGDFQSVVGADPE